MLACIVLSINQVSGAEELKATLTFTSNDTWEFPEGSSNSQTTSASFSDGTYTITLAAATGYYYNTSGMLMLGKNGSTLTLPAFSWTTTKIVVTGKSGASGSVGQNIFVGTTAVSTATTGATGTNTYEINSSYQAAGNVYVLKVTTNHNTQITEIKIYGESGGGTNYTVVYFLHFFLRLSPVRFDTH